MLKIIFRIFALCLLAFILVQPYNIYCRTQGSCSQFHFADLLPTIEGKEEFQMIFEIKNYRPDIEITVAEPQMITTVTGRKNIVNYQVENITNRAVRFRPEFYVEPSELKNEIATRECLCFKEHIIKKGEKVILSATFIAKNSANEFLRNSEEAVRIGYVIR